MMRSHTSRKMRITVNCGRIAVALSGGPPAHERRDEEEMLHTVHVCDTVMRSERLVDRQSNTVMFL